MPFIKNMLKRKNFDGLKTIGQNPIIMIGLLFIWPFAMVQAENDSPHPVSEKVVDAERAPLNLDDLELEELLNYKSRYLDKIKVLQTEIDKIKDEKGRLIAALANYDEQRIKIADMIPQLIEHYSIGAPLNATLMTYAETLHGIYEDYKDQLNDLEAYKSYDFRIGIAYTSMMAQLAEYEGIYRQMQKDMEDEKTLLGGYQASLKEYYARVEEIISSEKMKEFYSLRQIEKELVRINEEIDERY